MGFLSKILSIYYVIFGEESDLFSRLVTSRNDKLKRNGKLMLNTHFGGFIVNTKQVI